MSSKNYLFCLSTDKRGKMYHVLPKNQKFGHFQLLILKRYYCHAHKEINQHTKQNGSIKGICFDVPVASRACGLPKLPRTTRNGSVFTPWTATMLAGAENAPSQNIILKAYFQMTKHKDGGFAPLCFILKYNNIGQWSKWDPDTVSFQTKPIVN